jgi:hypothetical protein
MTTVLTAIDENGANRTAPNEDRASQPSPHRVDEPWSASRAEIKLDEKTEIAKYFCKHDFLVGENQSPESGRDTVASILVNQGTTPNRVVLEVLQWIEEQDKHESSQKPFFLTWYTPGHLVPTTLRLFRDKYRHLKTATKLFLFPGEVDEETESVSGPDAEDFAERVQRKFTYAFLSSYSFDVVTGSVYFHLPRELRLQKACAKLFASHKFLFLDSSKFKREGERGYGIGELLQSADKVTIYTVSSSPERDQWIKTNFLRLCAELIKDHQDQSETDQIETDQIELKTLRLQIVGLDEKGTTGVEKKGILITAKERRNGLRTKRKPSQVTP